MLRESYWDYLLVYKCACAKFTGCFIRAQRDITIHVLGLVDKSIDEKNGKSTDSRVD